ncbi:MAG: alpha/beta hydrolase [Chlamydiota bacterium]
MLQNTIHSVDLLSNPKFKEFIDAFTNICKASQELPLTEARRLSTQFFLSEGTIYEPISRIENVEILSKQGHKIPLRIFTPSSSEPLPALVYFHRGGFVFGNIEEADPVCRKLANHLRCVVVAVEYRLCPEYPFPKPLEDCYEATEWVSENVDRFGGDSERLIVCGESVGGNLAAAVTLMARDNCGPSLSAQLLICPAITADIKDEPYDNSADCYFLTKDAMKFFWSVYLQSPENRQNVYASPDLVTDFSNLPPMLVITAEHDPLQFEAMEYAEKLRQSGVKVISKSFPEVIHGFIDLPTYDETQKIEWIKEIAVLLKKLEIGK